MQTPANASRTTLRLAHLPKLSRMGLVDPFPYSFIALNTGDSFSFMRM